MSIVSFLISTFGILSVLRMLRIFRDRALISTTSVTKTGTVTCVTLILAVIFLKSRPIFLISSITGTLIVIFFSLRTIERRQIDTLKLELPHFLDRWILLMRLGSSLSSSRQMALRESGASLRTLLEPIFLSRTAMNDDHMLLSPSLLADLRNLEVHPHNALSRLENTRMMIRKTNAFRRKSGQARRQTTIQATVLLSLQIALAIFTLTRFGASGSLDLVIWSFLLSTMGFWLMHRLARKTQWKI